MARKKRPSADPARDLHQRITDRLIEHLKRGVKPWRAGFQTTTPMLPLRHNGEPYAGINVMILWAAGAMAGYRQPRWMTYRQAKTLGGQVRRGESGETVVYASTYLRREELPDGRESERACGFLKSYTVFNVEQIDDLPAQYIEPLDAADIIEHPHEPIASLDRFYAQAGMRIVPGGNPAYSPLRDEVMMPPLARYHTVANYYADVAHEAIHWTGHHSRLDRNLGDRARERYCFEELIAEIGSAFLNAEQGLLPDFDDKASYLDGYIRALRNDKRLIFRAAAAASKACEHLQALQLAQRGVA